MGQLPTLDDIIGYVISSLKYNKTSKKLLLKEFKEGRFSSEEIQALKNYIEAVYNTRYLFDGDEVGNYTLRNMSIQTVIHLQSKERIDLIKNLTKLSQLQTLREYAEFWLSIGLNKTTYLYYILNGEIEGLTKEDFNFLNNY